MAGVRVQKKALLPGSHSGAVLTLAWNRTYRHLLASGSDDTTVKLWDVTTRSVVHTYTHHSEPVRGELENPGASATVCGVCYVGVWTINLPAGKCSVVELRRGQHHRVWVV